MFKKKYILPVLLCFGCLTLFSCGGTLFMADSSLSSKKYDDAISLYKEYLAEQPDSVQARSRLGFAYLKTGRLDQAIEEFNTVLKAEPGEPYSILYLGLAYLNKGLYGETIKTWQTYRNKKQPLVEQEIKRLLTLVVIAESQQLAKKAVEEEEKLKTDRTDKNTVAVCYYKDLSPDKSMLAFQKGLAAMVITDMSKIKSLKVVERLRLQALLEEMNLGKIGIVDEQTAPRVGRLLGAENLVVGNLTLGINATTSLASSGEGAVKGTSICTEKQEDFFLLPCCIVQKSAKIIGVSLSSEELSETCIPHTKNYDAFIYFGEGLDALDAGKWSEARDFFEKALREDPQFMLAKIWADSCPSPTAPSISGLKSMTAVEVASHVEAGVDSAIMEQKAVGQEAAEAGQDDGGGGH